MGVACSKPGNRGAIVSSYAHKKLPSRLPLTLVLLSIISLAVPRRILPQAPPKMPDSGTALAAARGDQQPFDKLELFGFFAAGPIDTYARQVIDARGTTFKPDWEFIRLFPYSGQQDVLRDIKPRATGTISPGSQRRLYSAPTSLGGEPRNRQFAAASEKLSAGATARSKLGHTPPRICHQSVAFPKLYWRRSSGAPILKALAGKRRRPRSACSCSDRTKTIRGSGSGVPRDLANLSRSPLG